MRQIAFWEWASLGPDDWRRPSLRAAPKQSKLNNRKAFGFPNFSQISPRFLFGQDLQYQ
jgi:hypothetical protein